MMQLTAKQSAFVKALWPALRGVRFGVDIINSDTGEVLVPAHRRMRLHLVIKIARCPRWEFTPE